MTATKLVSMTPAVFHLSDAVNEVSQSYGAAPIVPRGPRLRPLLDGVRKGIVEALGAHDYEAVLMTGTGSTAMAAVLGSCLGPGERLLTVRNGAYGDRIHTFAQRIGQPTVDLEMAYGERPDLERIEALCANDEVDAVAVVYGCTSSCNLNPVADIAAITRRTGKKLLVDGVSALFVEPFDVAAVAPAAIMGCCNKGLHSQPNLTFALVRRDLLAQMEHIRPRVPSLELYQTWRAQDGGSHPYTLDPLSLCQARAALEHLASIGGVAGRQAIYRRRCEILRGGYDRLGLRVARWPDMPLSSIGTALYIPEGHSYDSLAERLANEPVRGHAFEIYSAQGKLSGTIFRVFHMGEYPLDVYGIFLESLARVLG
jgi:2-aminoethylphosphonate-pyruvate transaminase